ncbi:MAG: hypothetical protein ABR573_09720 [Candidatus Dormibacteria bacterium]
MRAQARVQGRNLDAVAAFRTTLLVPTALLVLASLSCLLLTGRRRVQ